MGTVAPHVVVIPLPVHGHVNPLLQLSVQLAFRGVTVSFITTDSTQPRALAALRSILEDEDDDHVVRSNLRFLSLNDSEWSEKMRLGGVAGTWANLAFMGSKANEVEQLLESCCPVSCIILDTLLARILPGVGAPKKIPSALFWTASAVHMQVHIHLKLLVERGYAPLKFEGNGRENVATIDSSVIPGITQLRLCEDLPYVYREATAGDPRFEKMGTINLQLFLEAPWVLVNTFQEMEDDALCAMQKEGVRIVTVGPLLPMALNSSTARLDDASNRILGWLSTQPRSSVLYVSFGTMAEISGEQAEELAYGLEASGQPFLWVLGSMQGRESSFLEEFKLRTEDRGLMVSWCPQLHVLRHPSVGGFLTHCGWNSILESVSSGVPMIGWPCMFEQNLNCKYMVDVWKIGTRIATRSSVDGTVKLVTRGEIERAIRGLMASNEGNPMRKRARDLREAAKRAVEENGSSLRNMNDLVQAFKSSSNERVVSL